MNHTSTLIHEYFLSYDHETAEKSHRDLRRLKQKHPPRPYLNSSAGCKAEALCIQVQTQRCVCAERHAGFDQPPQPARCPGVKAQPTPALTRA